MGSEQLSEQVHKLKASLQEMEKIFTGGNVPVAVLEDFKMAVDHIRMNVWAVLSNPTRDQYEVANTIVRFRLKRAVEMLRQILMDIDSSEITLDMPELLQFHATLKDTLDRMSRLGKSGI